MSEDLAAKGGEPAEASGFVCITCSDQALPARVLSIDEDMALARVAVGNSIEEVDISLVDRVEPGDTLLVHGGVALGNVGSA
jgi:hydrogenase maturation factor